MNKKILLKEEVKVLDTINTLQNKINEITYIDSTFDELMNKHFQKYASKLNNEEKVRLRITLLNLEELNLIEGDIFFSPRMTEEGKEILAYYKQRDSILYGGIGAITILSCLLGIKKIFKR